MIRFIKKFLSYRRFVKLANSVGFNLQNPRPVETLGFQTMAVLKLFPNKKSYLKCNDLALYDSIIFTLFWLRMICLTEIKDRTMAELFSNQYISYVIKFFPEGNRIAQKYDADFFTYRANYYDSILTDDTKSSDDKIEALIEAFISIINYDYSGKYVRYNANTPMMLLGFDDHLKINYEIKAYLKSIPDFFSSPIHDVIEYYNS